MSELVSKQLYEQYSVVTKALSSPQRLEILTLLAQRPFSVSELASVCNLSTANMSQHLQVLKRSKLIISKNSGLLAIYQLRDDRIIEVLQSLRNLSLSVSPELIQIKQSLFDTQDVSKPISMVKLAKKLRKNNVVIYDSRSIEEYQLGHIVGAISGAAPMERTSVPDMEIVVYGRTEWCPLAYTAAARLNALGHKTRRLDGGFPEWKHAGFPIEP